MYIISILKFDAFPGMVTKVNGFETGQNHFLRTMADELPDQDRGAQTMVG